MADIKAFINPKSVAVVGVSRDEKKIGRLVFEQLRKSRETVYAVNPNFNNNGSKYFLTSLKDLPKPTDLAVYAVPAEAVVSQVELAASLGIKNHLIISSGFKEIGKAGTEREIALKRIIEKYHINVQGPNCLGNISPVNNFNASFGFNSRPGNIAIVSQSGAMGTAFLDWTNKKNLGISSFFSLGNKIDLNENDYLNFLKDDKKTAVIALYLESVGDGEEFVNLVKKVSKLKPVVVIKGGQTPEAKMAITSHTGALAGSFSAIRAAFSQANLIEAQNLEDFFNLIEFCSRFHADLDVTPPIIISNAGGPSVVLVDKYAQNKIPLAKPSKLYKKQLSLILPASSSLNNPIDMLGDANVERLMSVLSVTAKFYPRGIMQIILTPQENTDLNAMSKKIYETANRFKGKIFVSLIGGNKPKQAREILDNSKTVNTDFADRIPYYLRKIENYLAKKHLSATQPFIKLSVSSKLKKTLLDEIKNESTHDLTVGVSSFVAQRQGGIHQLTNVSGIVRQNKQGQGFLPEETSLRLAKAYRFPLVPGFLVKSEKELLDRADSLNYPLALKVSDVKIIHRNAVNGVRLNLNNKQELLDAFKAIMPLSKQYLLQEMIVHDTETVIGAKKDIDFSYLLMFGSGGIHADYLSDVSFGVLPFTFSDMLEMVSSTKISALIPDKLKFWPLFNSLLNLLSDFTQIEELDINPVVVLKNKLYCVDFKIKV